MDPRDIVIDSLSEINADLSTQIEEKDAEVARLQAIIDGTYDRHETAYAEFNSYLERNFQVGVYLPDDLRQTWEAFNRIIDDDV